MKKIRLCFLWHMHQPSYWDPDSSRLALPWVRLHALRGYRDMAALAETHGPQTFNLTACLVEQLEGLADGSMTDVVQELGRKPTSELSLAERELVLRHFFSVAWEHNIRPLPRYAALLSRRGVDLANVDLRRAVRLFSDADLRDLQVFFHLAWCGHVARTRDAEVAALWRKGGGYSEEEKASLLRTCDRMVAGILPTFRALASAGQVELTTTPYYHPILPLLIDSDSAAVAQPDRARPPRFSAPDDAREQVARARARHERVFGAPPRGMWPAEGSVSPEVVPIFEEAGVEWIASDEGVLLRSLPPDTARDAALYRPWRLSGKLVGFFRDHGLSDLLGFTYQRLSPAEVAEDFVGRLAHIARVAPGDEPTIAVILDGENPWEHYPGSGHDHLVALFGAIEKAGFVELATFADASAAASERLPRLHSGSWIEHSFRIWIGGDEENRAWTLLGEARQRLRERGDSPGAAAARDHLLAAEGSDWFWWYGDDFAADQKPEFDRLFRARVRAAYRELGEPPPAAALEPISQGRAAVPTRLPTALISPVLGSPNVLGWLGAGRLELVATRGSMFGGEAIFGALEFGFDLENLYLRLVPRVPDWRARLAGGEIRLLLRTGERRTELRVELETQNTAVEVHLGRTLECRVPFAAASIAAGDEVGLAVLVADGGLSERHPAQGQLAVRTARATFPIENWCA